MTDEAGELAEDARDHDAEGEVDTAVDDGLPGPIEAHVDLAEGREETRDREGPCGGLSREHRIGEAARHHSAKLGLAEIEDDAEAELRQLGDVGTRDDPALQALPSTRLLALVLLLVDSR